LAPRDEDFGKPDSDAHHVILAQAEIVKFLNAELVHMRCDEDANVSPPSNTTMECAKPPQGLV
jgi:hypothetical protein